MHGTLVEWRHGQRENERRSDMSSKRMSMRADNDGLTVRVNLFALTNFLDDVKTRRARLWIKGLVTNAETKKAIVFNDAGELITILGKWNTAKFKQLRAKSKR
jgi:hypothetical protein